MTRLDHLVQRCRKGELAAFGELFQLYQLRVFRLAVAILRDECDAEDAMQDVFLRVFERICDFRGDAPFSAWLTTIVVNCCRDKLRRRKVRRALSLEWLRGRAGDGDVSETVARHEARETLWSSVDRLDDAYRLPVILRYHEGLSCEEIAGILGLRISTVYSRLHTARERLRGMLQEPSEGKQVVTGAQMEATERRFIDAN